MKSSFSTNVSASSLVSLSGGSCGWEMPLVVVVDVLGFLDLGTELPPLLRLHTCSRCNQARRIESPGHLYNGFPRTLFPVYICILQLS